MERLARALRLDQTSDFVLEWLTGAAFAAGVLGAGVIGISTSRPPRALVIAAAVLLTMFYVIVARAKDLARTHRFSEGSPEETSFYREWYARRGIHTVFTNDFNWMTGTGEPILETILGNPQYFTIFVRHPALDGRNIAERLIRAGVRCHVVPDSIQIKVRFSLWQDGDHAWLILRDKRREIRPRERVFRETDEDYMIAVIEDLLRSCEANA